MINAFAGVEHLDGGHEAQGKLVHVERLRMRWGDMDALGHMNNAMYFRYLEQARIAWFDSLGLDYRIQPEGPILGSISCRFVLPIVYPADLEVTVVAGAPRRSTFSLYSEIRDAKDPKRVYTRAVAVVVWIDLKQGRSRVLPGWLKSVIRDPSIAVIRNS